MKVLLLHKYARKSASFRYRLEQYLPYLIKESINYDVESLLSDKYLEHKFSTGERDLFGYLPMFFRRLSLFWKVHNYNLVIIFVEFLPYFPALFERYLKYRGIPYIFDFDDPVFHYYDLSNNFIIRFLFKKKFHVVIKNAVHVYAGSPYLVDYSKKHNKNVSYLPTVVDSLVYNSTKELLRIRKVFTIGWIGSPSTSQYLKLIADVLKDLSSKYDIEVVLIGSGDFELEDVNIKLVEWTEDSEIANMLNFDVGIMPLNNDLWSQGKCGFKLIQYMACGLPVIASNVGVNNEIVQEGVNGYLVENDQQWSNAFKNLIQDEYLCQKLGLEGRKRFENDYSLVKTAPKFLKGIKDALNM